MTTKLETCLEIVRQKCSAVVANRLAKLSREFATTDAFLNASRGELMSKWQKLTPDLKKGLGDNFFDGFDVLLSEWKKPENQAKSDTLEERVMTQDALLWMATFLEQNNIPQMPLGKILGIYDTITMARKV